MGGVIQSVVFVDPTVSRFCCYYFLTMTNYNLKLCPHSLPSLSWFYYVHCHHNEIFKFIVDILEIKQNTLSNIEDSSLVELIKECGF